jgi:hypothetical protein
MDECLQDITGGGHLESGLREKQFARLAQRALGEKISPLSTILRRNPLKDAYSTPTRSLSSDLSERTSAADCHSTIIPN